MAKWHGTIGYVETKEVTPGDWQPIKTERQYYGDVLRNSSRWSTSSDSTNDDLNISNQISIVADEFAYHNSHLMKYVEFMGVNWKITNVEVGRPRLILTIGGVYNG